MVASGLRDEDWLTGESFYRWSWPSRAARVKPRQWVFAGKLVERPLGLAHRSVGNKDVQLSTLDVQPRNHGEKACFPRQQGL